MVQMSVGEGQNVHPSGLERVAASAGFEVATLVGKTRLEAFTRIDDGDAVRAFDEASTHGPVVGWSGRRCSQYMNIDGHQITS